MIKNECRHAHLHLDKAECLWCENCVEALVKRLKKKVSKTRLDECVEGGYLDVKALMYELGIEITPRTKPVPQVQQKPGVDDMKKYIKEKAGSICMIRHSLMSLEDWEDIVTQIVSDVEKPVVTKKDVFDFHNNLMTITEDSETQDESVRRELSYIRFWLRSNGLNVVT